MYDLDEGVETQQGADLWWEQVTETERYLVPTNGACFAVIGQRDFDSITRDDLSRLPCFASKIDGSAASYGQVMDGTVILAVTSERRFTKFRVNQYGYDLVISWVTYSG